MAEQRDEAAFPAPLVPPAIARQASPHLEMLELRTADRDDQHAALGELRAQRLGNTRSGRGNEDPSIGRILLPPERPVAVPQRDVLHAAAAHPLLAAPH